MKIGAVIKSSWENIDSNFLAYCASYYPWINTSIVTEKDITFYNIEKDSLEKLEELILNEFSKKSGVTNEAVNELMDKFKLLLTMKMRTRRNVSIPYYTKLVPYTAPF